MIGNAAIAIVIAVAFIVIAMACAAWLDKRQSRFSKVVAKGLALAAVAVMLAMVVAVFGLILWAKLSSDPVACARCD